MKAQRKVLPDVGSKKPSTIADGNGAVEKPVVSKTTTVKVPGQSTEYNTAAEGRAPVEVKAKEPAGVTPQRSVGYGDEQIIPKGYNIYPVRPEWAPYMQEGDAFTGQYKAGGANTPGDLPFLDGVEASSPKRAEFQKVGLTNLEKLGVPRFFDQTVTITRADGTKADINLVKAPDGSVPIEDFHLVLEEVMKLQTFEVNSEVAAAWGVPVKAGDSTTPVRGIDALKAVDKLLIEAVDYADKGLGCPIPRHTPKAREDYVKVLRQFAVNNLWHSVTLTVSHQAAGLDPKKQPEFNENFSHDLVEPMPLKDLAWQLMKFNHEPWMDAWLFKELEKAFPGITKDGEKSLTPEQVYASLVMGPGNEELFNHLRGEDDATNKAMAKMKALSETDPVVQARIKLIGDTKLTTNPNAANPHYLVAMFEWGGSREDSNTLCHPHRGVKHHDGTSADPINLQLRFANGAVHHAGVEPWPNVRHEYFLGWDKNEKGDFGRFIEAVIEKDPAFRSPIVKKGSFEMVKYERAMMEAGYMPPATKLALPEQPHYVELNHAYQELEEVNKEADNRLGGLNKALKADLPTVSGALRELTQKAMTAMDALTRLDAVPTTAVATALKAFDAVVAGAKMDAPADRKLVADLGQALQVRLIQQSPSSVERTAVLAFAAEDLRTRLETLVPDRPTLKFVPAQLLLEMRETLEALPEAIKRSRERPDNTMAEYYTTWHQHVTTGYPSVQH